ncbi:hypothetical protein F5148DRAFT_1324922 [Russula earlei]|uniref:Uncharacterized protein n=1 Tax=Russula earlei TaxID=71964 RepID=A0ACC0UI16_9AGAM|nr:hypothetical protein F5148DRAFT_1324922 [Russula earlei]
MWDSDARTTLMFHRFLFASLSGVKLGISSRWYTNVRPRKSSEYTAKGYLAAVRCSARSSALPEMDSGQVTGQSRVHSCAPRRAGNVNRGGVEIRDSPGAARGGRFSNRTSGGSSGQLQNARYTLEGGGEGGGQGQIRNELIAIVKGVIAAVTRGAIVLCFQLASKNASLGYKVEQGRVPGPVGATWRHHQAPARRSICSAQPISRDSQVDLEPLGYAEGVIIFSFEVRVNVKADLCVHPEHSCGDPHRDCVPRR